MLQFDDVLSHVLGDFGTYQKFCFILLGLTSITEVLQSFSPVYIQAYTDHWCAVPYADQVSLLACNGTYPQASADCEELVKNLTIPRETVDDGCGEVSAFSSCERYDASIEEVLHPSAPAPYRNRTVSCDYGWEYDTSQYKSTVTQQFDLVCDRYYLNTLSMSIYMLGSLVGGPIYGFVMDKYGRMPGLMCAFVLMTIFGVMQALSVNFTMFMISRSLLSISSYSVYAGGFVLAAEFVGPRRRTLAGMIFPMFYSLGYMLLTFYAYFIREWWILQLVITVPDILFLTYWWIVPESPRWLLSSGQDEKAEKIIRKCAKINKVEVPANLFDGTWEPPDDGKPKEPTIYDTQEDNSASHSALDLVRLPNMRKKTLIMFYIWTTNSLIYYGISFNTSALAGDDYLNALLSALVEIPAYAAAIFIMDFRYLGRRGSLLITMVTSGVGCICAVLVPSCDELEWLEVMFTMIGKFAITASYGMIYVYTAELFPTPVRATAIGFCSVCSCIGGALAPQLIFFSRFWEPLPFFVFGFTAILAGVLTLLLPETRNAKLPETLEEGEMFGKKPKKEKEIRGFDNLAMTGT
ncbi:organic cation transporter protein-like [Ptychodera flava]|uniref:organic cation transporter protein-like n=1 Tax=Ptychodera flava TaxID=63121 RepID=UPI00396A987A